MHVWGDSDMFLPDVGCGGGHGFHAMVKESAAITMPADMSFLDIRSACALLGVGEGWEWHVVSHASGDDISTGIGVELDGPPLPFVGWAWDPSPHDACGLECLL